MERVRRHADRDDLHAAAMALGRSWPLTPRR
jgi:hypothetical protein